MAFPILGSGGFGALLNLLPGSGPTGPNAGANAGLDAISSLLNPLAAVQPPPQRPAPPPVGLRLSPGIRTDGVLSVLQLLNALNQAQPGQNAALGNFLRPR